LTTLSKDKKPKKKLKINKKKIKNLIKIKKTLITQT
jgi:hypothetical protein